MKNVVQVENMIFIHPNSSKLEITADKAIPHGGTKASGKMVGCGDAALVD